MDEESIYYTKYFELKNYDTIFTSILYYSHFLHRLVILQMFLME